MIFCATRKQSNALSQEEEKVENLTHQDLLTVMDNVDCWHWFPFCEQDYIKLDGTSFRNLESTVVVFLFFVLVSI